MASTDPMIIECAPMYFFTTRLPNCPISDMMCGVNPRLLVDGIQSLPEKDCFMLIIRRRRYVTSYLPSDVSEILQFAWSTLHSHGLTSKPELPVVSPGEPRMMSLRPQDLMGDFQRGLVGLERIKNHHNPSPVRPGIQIDADAAESCHLC